MLKRRVLDPVKFVLPEDSSVECTNGEYLDFLGAGCDWDKLTVVEGEKPSIFVLAAMTHRQRVVREQLADGLAQNTFTVRCGLTGLINYWVERKGEAAVVEPPVRKTGDDKDLGAICDEDYVVGLALSSDQLSFLAHAIVCISEVNLPLLRTYGRVYGELTSSKTAS